MPLTSRTIRSSRYANSAAIALLECSPSRVIASMCRRYNSSSASMLRWAYTGPLFAIVAAIVAPVKFPSSPAARSGTRGRQFGLAARVRPVLLHQPPHDLHHLGVLRAVTE